MQRIVILLLLLNFSTSILNAQKPAFSSMDVFALEWADDPQISPDGKKVVYKRSGMDIMKDQRMARLWLVDTDGSNHQKLTGFDKSESSPRWSSDGKRIAFSAKSENDGSEIFVYSLKTGKSTRISQLVGSPSGLSWSPDGNQIAFSMFVEGSEMSIAKLPKAPKGAEWADAPKVTTRLKHEADGSGKLKPGYSQIFVIDADGGMPRQITSGNFHHRGTPVWSADGTKLFLSANRSEDWEYDFRNSEIYSVDVQTGEFKQLTDRDGPDRSIAISPDGKQLAYLGFDDKREAYQNTKLYVMNIDGSNKKAISGDLDRSFFSPVWASNGRGIYYSYDHHGNTKVGLISLSGKDQKIADNLGGTGIGRPYGGGKFSVSKNNKVVFTHTTPYHPSELGLVKKGNDKATLVRPLNDDLLNYRTLGQTEEIWYESTFDKRKIQGWIVKPPFFDASKKYPLLVENHGGPILNYGDRFSPEIQLFASKGYVVFYPNPRGSTSYGEEFANLLLNNYPGEDYNDVMDGVDAVLAKGYVSEDSLFVTGGSAGGIMSAWMIGKNNRFRAAAVVKPVMNWISKTLVADNYYGYANTRYPGQPWENPMNYWKFSPISLVGNIETPTLVMVGSNDMRTPLSEAKQLYHALKLRKIETALVEVPGAYHFIAKRPSQLIAKIEYVAGWFERYRGDAEEE